LAVLLDIAEQHRASGLPDAPPPSATRGTVADAAPGKTSGASGRRRSTMPMIEVARAATKEEALAGLERWKTRHPSVWPYFAADDVLVDSMRGRSSLWYRVRLNLRHVPPDERPPQEALEVDFDPFAEWRDSPDAEAWRSSRRRSP
jgi:bifunctional non-homologous end joining protein LigD